MWKHPVLVKMKTVILFGFSVIGAVWSFMQIIRHYFPGLEIVRFWDENISFLAGLALLGMLWKAFCIIREEWKASARLGDAEIVIGVGNILNKSKGAIVVGVNNQLKTKEPEVWKNGIHGKMIKKYGEGTLEQIFEKERKKTHEDLKFFSGEIKGKKFLFLCMSDLDEDYAAEKVTKAQLKTALDSLFYHQEKIRVPEERVYLPLLGTGGEGGLHLSRQDTVKFLIDNFLSFRRQMQENGIDKIREIHIVVHWGDVAKLDWRELRRWLENKSEYCMNCVDFS